MHRDLGVPLFLQRFSFEPEFLLQLLLQFAVPLAGALLGKLLGVVGGGPNNLPLVMNIVC